LFSRNFATPQPDWPVNTKQTGFLFYDRLGEGLRGKKPNELPLTLSQFLAENKPPVLFTLGSSAVMQAGSFYAQSLRAATDLGVRAILLVGLSEQPVLPQNLPASVFVTDYLPYSDVMPAVAAIVHQGGIGTTAQSLRAGKPMLVVPWAHDQPDNAERLRKIGVGRWIARDSYQGPAVARELKKLLEDQRYTRRAAEVGTAVVAEDGANRACDAVEEFLR
jgi:rhamnosyltransferase subunit B